MTKIGIFGAGSIGCHVGGHLVAGGADVVFVGRASKGDELAAHGLRLTDYKGGDIQIAPEKLRVTTSPDALADCAFVLIAVKSGQTEETGRLLSSVLPPGTVVLSLQNGVSNAQTLARVLPGVTVLAGMVPFNVAAMAPGHLHQGSAGRIAVANHTSLVPFFPAFAACGLPLDLHDDMAAVLWAKLLLNLNNAVNALANIPLKAELQQRAFRNCLALAMEEALALTAAAGIRLAKLTPVPMTWLPILLRLPDVLFVRLARHMLAIDDKARSSMSDDLAAGRVPEVAWINGEIVALSERLGRKAPVNARLGDLVMQAHKSAERPSWNGQALLQDLQSVQRAIIPA